jgi:ABC-type nitrate/sulfonate/bicarbonate transport system substrate-binding protein
MEIAVGSFTPSVLLEVARRTGRLAEAGLEVRELTVTSSPAQFRSLIGGELDVALTSPDNVLAYRFDPRNPLGALADVHILATVDRGMGLGLYARPGLPVGDASAEWLFGVDVATSGFALALFALAERAGIPRSSVRVVALGSTPNRLQALLAGDCDATMLNAGNELVAEAAGAELLGPVTAVCAPYVGTVVSVVGEARLAEGHALSRALREASEDVLAGRVDELAADVATQVLGLGDDLALRYVDRLKDPDQGLVRQPQVDREGLESIVGLRRRYLPHDLDGRDVLEGALEDSSGLVVQASGP